MVEVESLWLVLILRPNVLIGWFPFLDTGFSLVGSHSQIQGRSFLKTRTVLVLRNGFQQKVQKEWWCSTGSDLGLFVLKRVCLQRHNLTRQLWSVCFRCLPSLCILKFKFNLNQNLPFTMQGLKNKIIKKAKIIVLIFQRRSSIKGRQRCSERGTGPGISCTRFLCCLDCEI